MFCGKCGSVLPDGAVFCGVCGAAQLPTAPAAPAQPAPVAPVEQPVPVAEQPVPVAEQPVPVVEQPAPVVEQPVWTPPAYAYGQEVPAAPVEQSAPYFETPDFEESKPKKKGGLKKLILPIVAVVAAAAVVLCAFNWAAVKMWFYDVTGNDEKLRDESIESMTDTMVTMLSANYGKIKTAATGVLSSDAYATNTKVQLVLGDKGEDMILEAIPSDAEFEGLEELVSKIDGTYITLSGGSADSVMKSMVELGIGGTKVLDFGMIMDMNDQSAFVSIPVLTDLQLDISAIFEEMPEDFDESYGMVNSVIEALPEEEVLNKLLNKYISLALAQCDDVSKEKDTLSIGDIDQKVTVLETTIDGDALLNAATAVLEELQNDSDVEDIIVNIVDSVDEDGADLYDQFVDAIDDALDEMEDLDGSDMDVEIVLTQYLNSKYETVGAALEVDNGYDTVDVFYYGTATKGKNFAFELEVGGYEVLNGTGTNQKGIINGTYAIEMRGEEYATIKVSNFDKNAFKVGNLKGSFEIIPNADLIEGFLRGYGGSEDTMVGSILSALDLGIKLDFNTTETGGSVQISLTDDSEVLAGIKVESSQNTDEIAVPDPENTVDMEDMGEWIESFDFTEVISALDELGVPEEYLEYIEEYLNEVRDEVAENGIDLGGSSSSYDDYYDDYYDYYY